MYIYTYIYTCKRVHGGRVAFLVNHLAPEPAMRTRKIVAANFRRSARLFFTELYVVFTGCNFRFPPYGSSGRKKFMFGDDRCLSLTLWIFGYQGIEISVLNNKLQTPVVGLFGWINRFE